MPLIRLPLAAAFSLDHPARFLHWGVLAISVANLVVIAVMLTLFALAVLLPFPKGRGPR